jgi:alpha-tubulin suppressor-like RCC1 family protein
MPGQFLSPDGDLESAFVSDPAIIDQFAKTGSLWAWGKNNYGQLGDGTTTARSSPVQTVAAGTNWSLVSGAGQYWGGAAGGIKTDGTLWMWGENGQYYYGRVGDGTTTSRSSPVQIAGTTWKQLSCGGRHTAAIKTDGTLWAWGVNNNGGVGDGTTTARSSPVQTSVGGNTWKMVSVAGYHSTAAIKTDGTLWTWGRSSTVINTDFSPADKSTPVQAGSETTWKQVSLGYVHAGAIKTDGTLWMWGTANDGALGNNTTTNVYSPVQTIAGGYNWKQVSCGWYFTAAIKTDGTLWTWGLNSYGNLGDGTTTARSSPVQTISMSTNWKMVSAGNYMAVGIKTNGTLWTWGTGGSGALGDGTTSYKDSPVQTIAGGTNWKQASAGTGGGGLAIYFYDAGNLYP